MQVHNTLLVLCLVGAGAACNINVGEQGVSIGVTSGRATDEWKRTYTIAPGGRLEVININGSVEAFPVKGPQVEVVARREVKARTDEAAKEILSKSSIVESVSPELVRVEVKGEGGGPFGGRTRVGVEYRVGVPPGLTVSFRTENGAVRMEDGLDGRLTAASTNGPVIGHGLSGSVDASTVNGGVDIGFRSVSADSRIVTVNGGAVVTVPADIDAELDASAVNGGVETEAGLTLTASERTARRVTGKLNDGGPRIVVQTTNGGIRVGMSSDFARGRGARGRRRGPAGE